MPEFLEIKQFIFDYYRSSNLDRTIILLFILYIIVDRSNAVNHIGGVMVSVLASGLVDRGFEPRSGKTKDYCIGICCFSTKHVALR